MILPIYFNNKEIVLTTVVENETNFRNFVLKDADMELVFKTLKRKKIDHVRLIHNNEKTIFKKFLKKLPNVIAGGGKVYNKDNSILFIYRNDKWDLPKGKIEGKESIEHTAIREVEEETGVRGLEIVKPLETTYHIFKRNCKYKIKITHWFEMKTTFSGKLYPQENEGITKVEWLDNQESQKALSNSYANIKRLF